LAWEYGVLNWFEQKRRKLWGMLKACPDRQHKSKEKTLKLKTAGGEAANPEDETTPLLVDPADVAAPFTHFLSKHLSVSGDISVHYPASYQGSIKGTTLTGEVVLDGNDIKEIERNRQGPVGERVVASKGDEKLGLIDSESVSGDIGICIG